MSSREPCWSPVPSVSPVAGTGLRSPAPGPSGPVAAAREKFRLWTFQIFFFWADAVHWTSGKIPFGLATAPGCASPPSWASGWPRAQRLLVATEQTAACKERKPGLWQCPRSWGAGSHWVCTEDGGTLNSQLALSCRNYMVWVQRLVSKRVCYPVETTSS